MTPSVVSAILAGGRSTRMGTDKALLPLTPDGPTLLETVIARLTEAGLPPALIVTDTPDRYGWLGIPGVTDLIPGAGALGGILTAVTYSPGEHTLIVACDMPFLSPALLRYMASLPFDSDALVPRWTGADRLVRIEPLHAVYSRQCGGHIRTRIEARKLKVTDALSHFDVQFIEEQELRYFDPTLSSFRNINTTRDWADLLPGE